MEEDTRFRAVLPNFRSSVIMLQLAALKFISKKMNFREFV